jgi:hypothetical protein
MFVIRADQMNRLRVARRPDFVRALADEVARQFPEADRSTEQIERAIERARWYGLESPRAIRLFVYLRARFGWDVDERPDSAWLARALRDRTISDRERRVERAIEEAIRRERVVSRNRALRAEVTGGGGDVANDG